MRRTAILLTWLALAPAACATETGILVEITDLDAAKAAGGDTLRLFVGTDLGVRDASLVADTGVEPFHLDGSPTHTILLRPQGPLVDIGALQFAAAVTSEDDPPHVAFAAAATRVAFADGELRSITLTPTSQPFLISGPDRSCVTWASEPQRPFDRAIGLRTDADCDTVDNQRDCGPFDPKNFATHPIGDPASCMACPTASDPEICDDIDQNCDGRPAPPVPCAIPNVPGGNCFIGLRTCDSSTSAYGPCDDIDAIPSRDGVLCDILNGLDACLLDPDPIGCVATDAHRCRVSLPAVGCAFERLTLTHAPTKTCDWRIIGGVNHDQWLVGFQDGAAGLPMPHSTQCTTTLVARMTDPAPDPSPRTVIIAGQFSDVTGPLLELVTLERGGDCNGEIECDTRPFPISMARDQPAPASPALDQLAPRSLDQPASRSLEPRMIDQPAPASPAPTITGSIIAAPVPSP